MLKEAAEAGFYKSPNFPEYPKLQIITIDELLRGETIKHPRMHEVTFKHAPKAKGAKAENLELALE